MSNRYKWSRINIVLNFQMFDNSNKVCPRVRCKYEYRHLSLPILFYYWLVASRKNSRGFVVEGAGYQAPNGLSRDTNHNSIDSATTPKYARPVFSYPLSLSRCSPLEIAFHASRAEVRGSWNVIICPVRLFSTRSRLDSRRIIDVAAFATTERQARGRDFFQYFLVEGESLLFLGEIELLF